MTSERRPDRSSVPRGFTGGAPTTPERLTQRALHWEVSVPGKGLREDGLLLGSRLRTAPVSCAVLMLTVIDTWGDRSLLMTFLQADQLLQDGGRC